MPVVSSFLVDYCGLTVLPVGVDSKVSYYPREKGEICQITDFQSHCWQAISPLTHLAESICWPKCFKKILMFMLLVPAL